MRLARTPAQWTLSFRLHLWRPLEKHFSLPGAWRSRAGSLQFNVSLARTPQTLVAELADCSNHFAADDKKRKKKRAKSEGMSTRLTRSPFPCVVMQSAYSWDKRRGPVSAALSAEDLVTQRRRTVKYYRRRQICSSIDCCEDRPPLSFYLSFVLNLQLFFATQTLKLRVTRERYFAPSDDSSNVA